MGMLAGRGVAHDRIYPILLNYAKSDADPQVRQWAVEGMRFLGTDEALEQLYDSFIHDPSDAVRDRAGCNVSDCGIFTRKQRMRMVPKLITDEALPTTAVVWQNWYTRHGTEKIAEFEQMDWWKVRGDE
jgi:hypothetical protein